jgi:ATP:ADP antiporter, AAA family
MVSVASKLILAWSFFFVLLTSYYILKPIRDGLAAGIADHLSYWYIGSFLASVVALAVYARIASAVSPKWLLILVYQFFAICLLAFAVLSHLAPVWNFWQTGLFFVWVSVFNLNTVALFWSLMTDVFHPDEAKRWFGVVAGAGSVGALAGSGLTFMLVSRLSNEGLLWVSFIGMQMSIGLGLLCLRAGQTTLAPVRETADRKLSLKESPKPTLKDGLERILRSRYLLGICLFVFLGKFAATYCYNSLQIGLSQSEWKNDSQARTALFASMQIWTQLGSLCLQSVLFAFMVKWFHVRGTLAIPCVTLIALMILLFFEPTLSMLVVAQVTQQIVGYGIMTPGQNLLFTRLTKQDRYITKNFMDTVLFRFSDVVAAQLCTLVGKLQVGLGPTSIMLVPVLGVWLACSWLLGKKYDSDQSTPSNAS